MTQKPPRTRMQFGRLPTQPGYNLRNDLPRCSINVFVTDSRYLVQLR